MKKLKEQTAEREKKYEEGEKKKRSGYNVFFSPFLLAPHTLRALREAEVDGRRSEPKSTIYALKKKRKKH